MPRPFPDPNPGTTARLREAAERLRAAQDRTSDGHTSESTDYDSWTLARLRRRAAELDVEGRSAMNRAELIAALLPEPDDAASSDT